MKRIIDRVFVELSNTNVGIVKENKITYIIDTASNTKVAKKILSDLNESKMIIINTHGHADHIQGNKLFEKNGAKIYAHEKEIPFIQHPELEGFFLYGAFSPRALKASFYKAAPSSPTSIKELLLTDRMEIVDLPGHSPGMIGVKADNVLFCGDAYFGSEILKKYSYPYAIDITKFLSTLEKLESMNMDFYVPSHGKVTSDPHAEIEATRNAIHNFVNSVLRSLRDEKSTEEISFELARKFDVTLNIGTFYLFRSFVSAILTYLEKKGEITNISPGKWKHSPAL